MSLLSVVVSAFNEEKTIKECLESVKSIADEIIVIDNSSTDKTFKIAERFTSKIYRRPNNPMLNINKNFGFSKATCDWILNLDADERVTAELREEISNEINHVSTNGESRLAGFWIPRKNIIFGKWMQGGMWWPDYQLRLFRKGAGRFPQKHVHEYIAVDGETKKLEHVLLHENYSSVSQYLYKLDTIYTENEAENLIAVGKKATWIDAIRFPVGDFLKTFFAQNGYKDGLHGLVMSILQAFYAEIVFAKVWEKQGFIKQEEDEEVFLKKISGEWKKVKRDVWYWLLTSLMKETKNPFMKNIYRLQRKLKKS